MRRLASRGHREKALKAMAIVVLLWFQPPRLSALDTSRNINQLGHTAWRLQDGVFNGVPNAITQTSDGYLWIGTSNGLFRFDGIRFTPWVRPSGSSFPGLNVISLLGASDGSLWVGTAEGLGQINGAQAKTIEPKYRINEVVQDKSGTVWFGRSRTALDVGTLCKVRGNDVQCFGESDGLTVGPVTALAVDAQNSVWVGSSHRLACWRSGAAENYDLPARNSARGLQGVEALSPDQKGGILVGRLRTGPECGLQNFSGGKWKPLLEGTLKSGNLSVLALLRDRNGALWIGTSSDGVYRIIGNRIDHFKSSDGLSGDTVNRLFEDIEGNVWVATTGGIDRFRDSRVTTFSVKQGLKADLMSAVAPGQDNKIWINNFGALQLWQNEKISTITSHDGLPGQRVTSLFEDHTGALWVGVEDQLYVYEHNRFSRIEGPGGRNFGIVRDITEDSVHDIWAVVNLQKASPQPLVRLRDHRIVQRSFPLGAGAQLLVVSPRDGVFVTTSHGDIVRLRDGERLPFAAWNGGSNRTSPQALVTDQDGTLWAATSIGLLGWKGKRFELITTQNGLPCNGLNTLVFDRRHDLWLSTECGYIKVSHTDLTNSWNSTRPVLHPALLDAVDGAQPAMATFSPQSAMSEDGKLWFVTDTILQMIDPEQLQTNRRPPPVYIENVVADHRAYANTEGLKLPANTRDLEIDFTGLSLTAPEKVRFRYRLEGWNSDWQDSQGRRQVFYTNLRPKTYTFQVVASNNDGVWNDRGATIQIVISPAFYQTAWFFVALGFAALGGMYLIYLVRLRQVTGQIRDRISERVTERERIAFELHDTFFQSIQGLLLRFNAGTSLLKSGEPARAIFIETLEQSDRVMLEGRELVLDLRRDISDTLEFPESLAHLGQEFKNLSTPNFKVAIVGSPRSLRSSTSRELYRVAREAIYNGFLHSKGTEIDVEVRYEQSAFVLHIQDNGVGINEQVLKEGFRVGHLGLPGMQNRAKKIGGVLIVRSRSGVGTEIHISIPGSTVYEDDGDRHRSLPGWIRRKLFGGLNGGQND